MPETFPPVFILGVLLSIGFVCGLLAEKIHLPRVVAYIVVGAVFSPSVLGQTVHFNTEEWSPFLTDVALGIIAYIIGSEIDVKKLKKNEGTVLAAVLGQSLGAIVFVSLGMWTLGVALGFLEQLSLVQAMIFGAVATATAPAASLGVIEEYKAKGKMTNTLLGVIAVDDAVGIVFFTLIMGFATEGGFSSSLVEGFKEIGGAIILGGVMGILLGFLGNRLQKEELRLVIILGFIFLVFGFSELWNLSMLLSCMSLGFVSVLFYKKEQADWLLPLEHIEELVFIFFFTLAGAHFKFDAFASSALLILIYVVLRSIGKYGGTYAAMRLAGAEKQNRRLLGLCLFPQAGVAIGLAMRASNQPGSEELGELLINIVLGSTIIFELTAPFFTRFALAKVGDIDKSR